MKSTADRDISHFLDEEKSMDTAYSSVCVCTVTTVSGCKFNTFENGNPIYKDAK